MPVVAALRRVRRGTEVSLGALAERTGIAKPNLSAIERARREPTSTTIDRIAAALGVTLIPVAAGGRNTVADASEHVAAAIVDGDAARAYRAVLQLSNDLHSADPYLRALLAAEAPVVTGTGWDAFIAAVAEWRLAQAGLPAPAWTQIVTGDKVALWSPPGAVLHARPEYVAEPFRRRGVLVEADELASA